MISQNKPSLQDFERCLPQQEFEDSIHISVQNHYIYFANPKVACSTIKATLQKLEAETAQINLPETRKIHDKTQSLLLSPRDIGFDRFLAMLEDDRIFKFCFVRNPYTRLLSGFLDKVKRRWYRANFKDSLGLSFDVDRDVTFLEFVREIEPMPARDMNKHWRVQTQQVLWDWVKYDRVSKFENFNEEFRLILKKIYPQIAENKYNDILEYKINHATHANLKLEKFYTGEIQEIAQTIYADDFANFGYEPKVLTPSRSNLDKTSILAQNTINMNPDRQYIESFLNYMPKPAFERTINISIESSYIYFQVPKVACSTIKATLQSLEAKRSGITLTEDRKIHHKGQSPLLSPSHVGLEKFRHMLDDPNIFKFCLVRNPYTRILSAFLDKMTWKSQQKEEVAKALNCDVSDKITFEQFLEFVKTQNPYEMNPHWRPQTHQLFWGVVNYDFVGRFEDFAGNFNLILKNIYANESEEFKIENRTNHATKASKKIEKFYNTRTQDLVQEIYQADFESFNYSLELPDLT